jgi:hypothetical protein
MLSVCHRNMDLVLNMTEQIQREGGQSVSRLGELDHSLLVKIPFLAAFPPLWALLKTASACSADQESP